MEYTALYRKFRPLSFKEMVGQEAITRTLKNQIISGRVGHAYLFNGVRGTGKTSAAKIFARAINCLHPIEGEPCNECEICKASLEGSLTDIVEMDAASNNSVEDIRAMRDEVNFLPTLAKYRVYIIDEVHMLSTGAFNALLKTLEEPPAHVKFILATTEPQKLPATILSRCQRFDFKKIANGDIEKRLQFVCEQSKIDITEDGLKTIAVLAEGALRDALSILERCLQEGGTITQEKVKELVGIPKLTYVNQLTKAIVQKEVEQALEVIEIINQEGKDFINFIWELIKYMKDILVYKTKGKLSLYNKEELEEIAIIAEMVTKEELLQDIYELSNLENEMKWSSQKSIMFQVGIIKLCQGITAKEQPMEKEAPADREELNRLKQRLYELEKQIQEIGRGKTSIKVEKVASTPSRVVPKAENTEKVAKQTTAIEENGKPITSWTKIINDFKTSGKIMLYTNLMNTKALELNDMTIGIQFPNGLTPFGKSIIEKTENMNELTKQLSMEYGKEMRVKLIDGKQQIKSETIDPIQKISQELDIPINIIDE